MDASDRDKSAAEKSRALATETATVGEDGEEKAGGDIGDAATATEGVAVVDNDGATTPTRGLESPFPEETSTPPPCLRTVDDPMDKGRIAGQ